MYTVYADGRLLYHPQLVKEGYAIGNPSLTLEVNHSGSFTFTLMPTNRLYNYLTKMTTIITVYDNDEEIFRGRILNDEKDAYNRKNVYCEGELAFLLDSILRPYEFSGSITDYLTLLLNNHNNQVDEYKQFKVGNITVTDPNDYIVRSNTEYVDIWTELTNKLIGYLGGYISVRIEEDGRYIDYLGEYTQSDDQIIEFGVNMIDITQYITAEYLCTRLIPLGAYDENNVRITIASVNDGKDYIENETGISLFDKITKTYIWDDVTEPANLLSKAKEYLESNIEMSVSLTIKAIDLHLLDVNVNRIKKGYSYRILSAPHALDSYFDCTKVVLKLANPDNNEYTLGSAYTSLTEQQTNTNQSIELTKEQIITIKDKADKAGSVVEEVKNTVNTVYDNYAELTQYIDNLDTVYATIDFANIDTAAINNLFADMGYITELETVKLIADKGYITEAEIGTVIAEKGYITEAEADTLVVNKGYITKLEADEIYSTLAQIGELNADVADINTLLSGTVVAGSTQTIVLNAENTTVENALIKDAMIDSLAFNKITGVDINTTDLTIHSEDGKSTWKDNTIQIKDGSRTRVQMGKDSEGDYNIYIWDAEGNLMFDPLGLTDAGVTREVIDNSNVKENAAIHGSKLDIDSVITSINDSTETIKSSKIYFNEDKQSLDVLFNEMNTTVTDLSKTVETNTTNLSVAQGEITSLISKVGTVEESVENTESSITTLTNNYNSVKSTVDGHTQTIASNTSTIDKLSEDVVAVDNKVTTIQTDLSGFKATVSDTYATKEITEEVTSNTTRIAELELNSDQFRVTVNDLNTVVNGYEDDISHLTNQLKITSEDAQFLKTTVERVQNEIGGKVDYVTIEEWARFDGSQLELGASTSPFKAILSNTELGFWQGNNKVAWLSNNELHVLTAVITTSIGVGTEENSLRLVDEGEAGYSFI